MSFNQPVPSLEWLRWGFAHFHSKENVPRIFVIEYHASCGVKCWSRLPNKFEDRYEHHYPLGIPFMENPYQHTYVPIPPDAHLIIIEQVSQPTLQRISWLVVAPVYGGCVITWWRQPPSCEDCSSISVIRNSLCVDIKSFILSDSPCKPQARKNSGRVGGTAGFFSLLASYTYRDQYRTNSLHDDTCQHWEWWYQSK